MKIHSLPLPRAAFSGFVSRISKKIYQKASSHIRKEKLHPVEGLPQFAFMRINPRNMETEEGKKRIANQMLAEMKKWPSLSAVISMAPDSSNNTTLVVASRDDAIQGSKLKGVYEVMQRLCSSTFVKETAKKYPTKFAFVKNLGENENVFTIRLPGPQSFETVTKALQEGGKPNPSDQLADLIANLPKGRRVALLIAGPSAAGKSTFIKEIEKLAGERKVAVFSGDMYFREDTDPRLPKTSAGTPFWDDPGAMYFDEMTNDIVKLIQDGKVDVPVYNFKTNKREEGRKHVELGPDDIVVIDSLHAANFALTQKLENNNLPHVAVYLDTPCAENRLIRRVVRDYEERGRSMEQTLATWDETTFPGEVRFVRPTILRLDPAQDLFYVTRFQNDLDLSREEIIRKVKILEKHGMPPSYKALADPSIT